MSKTLEESKRSIQSTRIDVIAGDPMPIKPLDSLPINTVLRPKVEDPEYKPDTAPELAAALSALARLVPPEQASSIYIAIRELIEKIVPITHTSMDMIGEGKFTALDQDLEEQALKIRIEVEKRVADLRRQNSDYADVVAERLNDFGAKLYALIRSAAPAKGKPSPTESELEPIVVALRNMVDQYDKSLRAETEISPPVKELKVEAKPSQVTDPNTKFDAINRGQIIDAFQRRITALRSSGDSFDMQVARDTERRLSIVTKIMGTIKLDVARPTEPAPPTQTAPAARKPAEKITRWIFDGTEDDVMGEANAAINLGNYLLIRYTVIDSETEERSDQFRFVSPSKVAKKASGESVLIAKDVSGDFDLFYEREEKEQPSVESGTLLTFAFDRIAYAQLIAEKLLSVFKAEPPKKTLQEAAQPADKISPLDALYTAVTTRLNERNKRDHSHFSMRFTPRSGAPSGFYDIFLLPEFVPGRIREYPTADEVRYDPDSEKTELILGYGHVHVYRRFIQTFDGKDIEIQPDVRVDLAAIARDFIIAAADDLRRQDVDDAEKQAVDFFEEHRYYIIKDAINPTRVPDPAHPDDDRGYRAVLAAFNVANHYVDKTFSIDSTDRAEATSKWSLDKLSSVARSFEDTPGGPTGDEARDRAQRLRGSVKEMERQVAALARGKYDPSDRSSFGRLKPARLEEQRIAKIRRELRSLMSTGQGPVAVELARIENASFESFSAISSLDSKKLAEMTRNFDVSTMHPISRIPQPTPPARIEAAGQRAAAFITEAKKSTAQLSVQMKDALRVDLLTALRSLVEARKQAADRGISAAQTADPMFIDDLEEKHKDLAVAVAQLRELSQTVSAASVGRIKTLETAIDLFGQVAQLAPNNEPSASSLEDLRSATRLVAKGSIQRVIESALDDDGYPNAPEIGGAVTGLTSDTEEQHLLSLVGTAASILQRSFPGKRSGDLIGSDGAGPAFVFFGCTIDKQMTPIFAQGGLASLLKKSSLVKEDYLAVLSPRIGEELFNLSAGTLQKMSDTLALSRADDAANSALAFSEALFRDAIEDALGDSFPVFEGFRLIVYLACHLVETGFKNVQTAEEIARNRIVDSIEDALIAGSYGTRIDINALTGKAFSQYSVSVDQQEPGVGFFVDATGLPVARVVGSVDADILNREGSVQMRNHTRNASLMFAGSLVCIDPKLTRMAQSAFDTIVAATGDTLKESVNIKDGDIVEMISDAARDAILAQMQKSAARVNSSLSINPTERYIEDTDQPKTVKDFIEHNKRIMSDPRRTNLARMVAAAAISYAGHTQKLPDPGVGIQYYARIKTDDHTDPETGMPLLKQGHDFVLKTLPASVKHPSLSVYRGELTTSRERFLSTIMQLVDDHILTELHDPFGVIKPFVLPRKLEGSEESESEETATKRKKKNAYDYVDKVLLPDQAANALSIVQGEVRRSPFQIKGLPVLSVTSVIKSGMSSDELNKVFADARNFVVGMMLERGLGGGYIRTDTKLTESQIRDLPSNSEAAQNILSDVGEEILRAVQNHVAEKLHAAEGGTGITVGQGDDEERLTQSQVAGRVAQTSRAAIISRIAAEHHRAVGLEDPVQLFYDKKTGLPSTPPDPVEFFRARGVKTSKEARITDPVQHAMQLSIAYDEYRRHIGEMLGISPPAMGGFVQGQAELAKRFPEVLSDSKEKAQLESVDNKYTYSHEPISALNYDASSGTIVEIEGTVGQDASERRDVVKKLARMQAIFERDQAIMNRFETYSNDSRFARVFASVWPNITRQIRNVRVFVDSFKKQVENLADMRAETVMDRMPPEMSRTLLSLSVAYNKLATTFNVSCANSLQQLENEARLREAAKITSENIVSACQSALNRLRASGESEKFASLLEIVKSMGIAVSDDKTTVTLEQPKQDDEAEAEEKRDASGLPTLSGTDASTLIEELSKWRTEQVKSITKAYEKTSKAAGVAHEHIDAEIQIMARQLAPDVSRVLGAKVKPEVRIFETMDDLVSFANEIAADHTSALLRHLKDVQSERAREQINASVKSYLAAALGGTLYAVRVPPNRADDADAS